MRLKVFVSLTAVLGAVALAQAATGAQSRPLVGRWQTVRTCQGLVLALKKFGLAPLAPTVVGDYFPNQQPAALAKKRNLCQGAKPQLHWHFFASDGKFGSLDQHAQQVDDGTYRANGSTLAIGNSDVRGSFRFRVQGKTLMLTPLLTPRLKKEALADSLNFHTAGWMVAVSYFGHPWGRVACGKMVLAPPSELSS
jgi:hypothetical protein